MDQLATPAPAPAPARRGLVAELRDLLWFLIRLVVIVGLFRSFILSPFVIPSESMLPRLLIGDYLFVSKWNYGYSRHSVPFSWPLIPGRIWPGTPARGDIAVFKAPPLNRDDYIKRVIGLPGDEIRMIGGVLHINGKAVEKEFIGMATTDCDYLRNLEVPSYRETLPNGVSYTVYECDADSGPLDNVGPYQVPEGHYFMMGDNRDQSQDSRTAQVSYVPFEDVVGRAERIFFSVDGDKARFWEIWKWPFAIRYGRILEPVK